MLVGLGDSAHVLAGDGVGEGACRVSVAGIMIVAFTKDLGRHAAVK